MDIKEIRRAIMMTLGGTLIGTLLFIFGLSLNKWVVVVNLWTLVAQKLD